MVNPRQHRRKLLVPILVAGLVTAACGSSSSASASGAAAKQAVIDQAAVMPMDQLYAKAKAEGGTLTYYGGGDEIPAIKGAFAKAYPGITINQVDPGSSADLLTRELTEAKAGTQIADLWHSPLAQVVQVDAQGLLAKFAPTESLTYADNLKGATWTADSILYYGVVWNTNLVPNAEAPKSFEDLANPKWKGMLSAEPTDALVMEALAKYKYGGNEQKATDLMKAIALNDPKFTPGHNLLFENVASGASAMCWTCNNHHVALLGWAKGAPVNLMLTESVGVPWGQGIFINAPHPYAGALFARWALSKQGQTAISAGKISPADPSVPPVAKVVPKTTYLLTADDLKDLPRWTTMWNSIFNVRS